MRCPTCKTSLRSGSLHGHTISRCITCGGLWLELAELGDIVRQTEAASGPRPRAAMFRNDCSCPTCDRLLVPFDYAHDSGILLGGCNACGGVWLEEGQLELIAGYRNGTPATRRLEAALADELRKSNRFRLAKNLLRSRLLSGCVVIAYVLVALIRTGSLVFVLRRTPVLLLSVLCLWLPDAMGSLTGVSFGFGRRITHRTPGDFVAVGGWLLLLCLILVVLIARR